MYTSKHKLTYICPPTPPPAVLLCLESRYLGHRKCSRDRPMSEYIRVTVHMGWHVLCVIGSVGRLVCVFTVDNKLYFIHIVTAVCADPVRVGEVRNLTPIGKSQFRVRVRENAYIVKLKEDKHWTLPRKKQSDPPWKIAGSAPVVTLAHSTSMAVPGIMGGRVGGG